MSGRRDHDKPAVAAWSLSLAAHLGLSVAGATLVEEHPLGEAPAAQARVERQEIDVELLAPPAVAEGALLPMGRGAKRAPRGRGAHLEAGYRPGRARRRGPGERPRREPRPRRRRGPTVARPALAPRARPGDAPPERRGAQLPRGRHRHRAAHDPHLLRRRQGQSERAAARLPPRSCGGAWDRFRAQAPGPPERPPPRATSARKRLVRGRQRRDPRPGRRGAGPTARPRQPPERGGGRWPPHGAARPRQHPLDRAGLRARQRRRRAGGDGALSRRS